MRKTIATAATLVALLLSAPMATAQSRCTPNDVVVVDRARFTPTIERAQKIIRDHGAYSTGLAYVEGSDVENFARRVAAFHPQVVVVHYSMFRPGAPNRGKVTASFLAMLQEGAAPPTHYILYSSSFFNKDHNERGRTRASLRKDGLLAGLPDDSVTLIYVDNGARFTPKNGAAPLGKAIRDFVAGGGCRR